MFFLCISCRLKAFSFVFYLCCQSSSCCSPSTFRGGNFFLLLSTTISSNWGLRGFRNKFNALIYTVPAILCVVYVFVFCDDSRDRYKFPILQNYAWDSFVFWGHICRYSYATISIKKVEENYIFARKDDFWLIQ